MASDTLDVDATSKHLENEEKLVDLESKKLDLAVKQREFEEEKKRREQAAIEAQNESHRRARMAQADELQQKADHQKKKVERLEAEKKNDERKANDAKNKAAKEKSDRLWGYSKLSIAAVVAVILLVFFVMYKINEGMEAARIKLPDAYTKIFNGPLLGKAVQGNVSFTGLEKDRVETCASICKKMFSCRGFNYKAEKCEIVTSESIFATVVDSPGSAAYEKK